VGANDLLTGPVDNDGRPRTLPVAVTAAGAEGRVQRTPIVVLRSRRSRLCQLMPTSHVAAASVNMDDFPSDEVVGHEHHDGLGDILGLSNAADGKCLRCPVRALVPEVTK
jgi:hypothetical protein